MPSSDGTVRDEAERGGDAAPATRAERVYGWIGGAALVAALGFGIAWLSGAAGDDGAGRAAGPPALVLLLPEDDASVGRPLVVEFSTAAPLQLDATGGWGANGLHLHMRAGPAELMPGPGDVRHYVDDRWRWTVRGLEPGSYRVRLHWSGADHLPLDAGASEEVDVNVL
jgi:hypothetical protein